MIPICDAWEFEDVDKTTNEELKKMFLGSKVGYVMVGPKKYFFPTKYATDGPGFYNFQPRSTDTWVISFPRSGTTWTQELVWMLTNGFDYQRAANIPLAERFPFLEFSSCVDDKMLKEFKNGRDHDTQRAIDKITAGITSALDATQDARCIKSHLPLSLLSPRLLVSGAKVIYVARNPKDVAVSYYHLHRLFRTLDYVGDFSQFWDYFENDQLIWCPYWSHLKEAWDLRHSPNLLFLYYEELQKDIIGTIRRIADFLNIIVSPEDADKLAHHLDIENFRNNSSVNFQYLKEYGIIHDRKDGFIRNGGSKKQSYFTLELEQRANAWIEKNLKNTSLRFPVTN